MESIWLDIGIGVIEIVYTFIIVFAMDFAVKKGLSQDISRKIVHMWAGGLVMFWFFYTTQWGKYIFMVTPFIWVLLLIFTAFTKDSKDPTVKSMTRTGNPKELLLGVMFFPLMLIVMTFLAYRSFAGVAAIAAVGFGDGIAPIIGKYLGKHKYKLIGREKTLEGSISVFVMTFIASLVLGYAFFGILYLIGSLIAAGIAVVLEAVSPRDVDNIIIPLAVWGVLIFVV
jgi:dolichol kinase